MKKLNKCKQVYQSLKIPSQLEDSVINALKKKEKTKIVRIYKPILTIACSFCLVIVILLNVNPTFAKATYGIPIIGNIAKVFTIREYKEESKTELVNVKMPALVSTGNTELEKRINEEILEKVNALIEEAKAIVTEFKQWVEKEESEDFTFQPMEITIDYSIKCSDDEMVSFVLSEVESFRNFQEERFYYNINLKTGKEITLQDMLGENYKEIANAQIKQQIEQRKKTDKEAAFFDDEDSVFLEHGESFAQITEDQDFYINEKRNVVIVFDKYTIAPGYMGVLEFEIIK